MCIFGNVHHQYKEARDLPACVHSLWHLYGVETHGAVQIRTAGVRKCRLLQSAYLAVVYCLAHFWNRTPIVRGTMGPPSLRTQLVVPVRCQNSVSCTDSYSECTKCIQPVLTVWCLNSGSCTHPYSGCTKCRLCLSSPLGMLYCHVHF